jgi:hypothetical protein
MFKSFDLIGEGQGLFTAIVLSVAFGLMIAFYISAEFHLLRLALVLVLVLLLVFSQLVFVLQVFAPHWFFSNSPQKCKRL